MMNFLRNIWDKITKSNSSVPEGQILIPKTDKVVVEVTKPKRPRKKKEYNDGNIN